MEDTVTQAKQEREKQGHVGVRDNERADRYASLTVVGPGCAMDGADIPHTIRDAGCPWEVEVSYGGEADLHQHLKSCDKNPGHQKFVPVDQFNVDHLPPGCHDNDLVDYVRAMSDLTVRLSVKYVSESRPETVHGRPYPSYKGLGSKMTRVGTGWVRWVQRYPDDDNFDETCPCQECANSPTPKTQFAHIQIKTAAHVVYDDLEAAHTTCHLFFDKGSTPDACSGVVTLSGGSVLWSNAVHDFCEMRYVTHDLDLADKLDKMVKHFDGVKERLHDKYGPQECKKQELLSSAVNLPHQPMDNLTIIVSHPHGCSKQVSVGYLADLDGDEQTVDVSNDESDDYYNPTLRYTTATCPGSSGSRVFLMKGLYYNCYNIVTHCGKCEEDHNLNFSYVSVISNR